MRSLSTFAAFLLFFSLASAATIHVPGNYPKIQEAIDAAGGGDVVLVAPGTYAENIDFKGKAITVQSSGGSKKTIIDGSDAGPVVIFQNGENQSSVLDGFSIEDGLAANGGGICCLAGASPTITNNHLYANDATSGAGIYCEGGSPFISLNILSGNKAASNGGGICCQTASPTISCNKFVINMGLQNGGGVCCIASSPQIIGNSFIDNGYGSLGGAIACFSNSYPLISDNVIDENVTNGWGGGIACSESFPTITGNIIKDNDTSNGGGGIYCYNNSAPHIVSNIFSGNFGNYWGGGVCCQTNAAPLLANNTFFNNYAKYGGGVYVDEASSNIINTILWSDGALSAPEVFVGENSVVSISHSDVDGGQASCYVWSGSTLNWGSGMIDADPLFVDDAAGDFHLTYPSPCKDVGDNSAVITPVDFEGDPRAAYGTVDMGADEYYTHLYWTGDASPGGAVALKFVGIPGTLPVQLWLGSGVMDPPMQTKYGDWHLQFPLLANIGLGSIPPPDGILVLPFVLPPTTPTPLTLPFQAGIGVELTNLSVMEVD